MSLKRVGEYIGRMRVTPDCALVWGAGGWRCLTHGMPVESERHRRQGERPLTARRLRGRKTYRAFKRLAQLCAGSSAATREVLLAAHALVDERKGWKSAKASARARETALLVAAEVAGGDGALEAALLERNEELFAEGRLQAYRAFECPSCGLVGFLPPGLSRFIGHMPPESNGLACSESAVELGAEIVLSEELAAQMLLEMWPERWVALEGDANGTQASRVQQADG